VFTTQMLVNGEPGNARDMLTQRMDKKALQTILVDFKPMAGSTIGELAANFDIVLGRTASDVVEDGKPKGVAKSELQRRG
jgi:protocatechuate 3,4-dioxygenase beta subunit